MGSNGEGKWKQGAKAGRIRWSGRMSGRPNYLALAAGVILFTSMGCPNGSKRKLCLSNLLSSGRDFGFDIFLSNSDDCDDDG